MKELRVKFERRRYLSQMADKYQLLSFGRMTSPEMGRVAEVCCAASLKGFRASEEIK